MRSSNGAERTLNFLVIGDAVLDQDIIGDVDRISPEAPVPYVEHPSTQTRAGGAGLAATIAARAGHAVSLVAALSDDAAGRRLRGHLSASGVDVTAMEDTGPTAVMTRVRARDRTLVMIDESVAPAGPPAGSIAPLRELLSKADVILVADYGRGMTHRSDIRELLTQAASLLPVVWDPHPDSGGPVPGVALATPNSRESVRYVRAVQEQTLQGDVSRARLLLAAWKARAVAVTRGADGAVLVEENGALPLAISPLKVVMADGCGAGDYLDVYAASSLARGLTVAQSLVFAVDATAAYLGAGGVTKAQDAPSSPSVGDLITRTRAAGGRIVATSGCFDILHAGHVSMLQHARRLGDCLIVCLNSDTSVRALKGPGRPVVAQGARQVLLEALSCVDGVLSFDEESPASLLSTFRPDLFVKGADYVSKPVFERGLVEEWGGQVVLVPFIDGSSTTSLIETVTALRGAS